MDNKDKRRTGTKQGRVRKGRRTREEEVMKGAAGRGEDGSLQIDVFSLQAMGQEKQNQEEEELKGMKRRDLSSK